MSAYSVMPSHVHVILVAQPERRLRRAKKAHGRYTRRINFREAKEYALPILNQFDLLVGEAGVVCRHAVCRGAADHRKAGDGESGREAQGLLLPILMISEYALPRSSAMPTCSFFFKCRAFPPPLFSYG